jgi:preprotein translocase subunit SecD
VRIGLTPEGGRKLAHFTRSHVGQRIAVVVGDAVYTAPFVMAEIANGNAAISPGAGRNDDDLAALVDTIAGRNPGAARPGVRTLGQPRK